MTRKISKCIRYFYDLIRAVSQYETNVTLASHKSAFIDIWFNTMCLFCIPE